MREIKFRGKRIDIGDWVYGYYSLDDDDKPIIWFKEGIMQKCVNIFPETVGQYTGIKDFYEGDIITDEDGYIRVIAFEEGCFVVNYENIQERLSECEDWVVIGNIHENPELVHK